LASNLLAQNSNNMSASSTSGTPNVHDSASLPTGDAGAGLQAIDLDLQQKAMQEHLKKKPNLIDMYETAGKKITSTIPPGMLDVRSNIQTDTSSKPEQWTYQMLIESSSIAKMIDIVVDGFRSSWDKVLNDSNSVNQHDVRWCIIIDNSGSMSLHRNAIYESLVVIMELLRKLESKFAVARFGARTNQKILKNLQELFTNADGQFVLEALTFDEGTYPATGLARVADRVFPEETSISQSSSIIHQLVLMITDGLTQERDDASYSRTITKNNLDLGFMFIETAGESSSQVLLKELKQAQNCIIKADNIKELPLQLTQLMHKMLEACLKKQSSVTVAKPLTINIKIPNISPVATHQQTITEKRTYKAANPTSYMISNPTANIPRLAQVGRFEQKNSIILLS
jgi:hypothetical protein